MILALDIATKTGYAYRVNNQLVAGTFKLTPPPKGKDCCQMDPRLVEMEALLTGFLESRGRPDLIVYEDVPFIKYRDQAFVWIALKTIIVRWAAVRDIPVTCCATTTLKKFGSGKGNATKEQMKMALQLDLVGSTWDDSWDDNAIDAIHLLRWAEQRILK